LHHIRRNQLHTAARSVNGDAPADHDSLTVIERVARPGRRSSIHHRIDEGVFGHVLKSEVAVAATGSMQVHHFALDEQVARRVLENALQIAVEFGDTDDAGPVGGFREVRAGRGGDTLGLWTWRIDGLWLP
jgi:hypothetical protein